MTSLADVILGNPDDVARVPMLRQGVVTVASPLTVLVGAAATAQACRALASYVPTVGDTVSVLVISGDRLVLGVASTPTAPTTTGVGLVNTGQSIAGYGQPALTWHTESFDTHGFHAGTSTDIVIPSGLGGTYGVSLVVAAASPLTALSDVALDRVTAGISGLWVGYVPIGKTHMSLTAITPLLAGDTLRVRVYNPHSSALTFTASIHVIRLAP